MYTVLIDESGDVGLKNIQTDPSHGPTQYFCMAATFFNEDNRQSIETVLRNLPYNRGALHANRLSHLEKVHFCKTVASLPVGIVGVVSNKLSLLTYLSQAKRTPTHYYNKVAQYLFERIGESVHFFGIERNQLKILLEAREQQYSSLLFFIESIQNNPHDTRSLSLRNFNRFSVSTIKKVNEPCMAISDMASNAIFSAVRHDAKTLGISETRYLLELSPVLVADKVGTVVPKGIKLIHSIPDVALEPDVAHFFSNLRNENREYWRIGK